MPGSKPFFPSYFLFVQRSKTISFLLPLKLLIYPSEQTTTSLFWGGLLHSLFLPFQGWCSSSWPASSATTVTLAPHRLHCKSFPNGHFLHHFTLAHLNNVWPTPFPPHYPPPPLFPLASQIQHAAVVRKPRRLRLGSGRSGRCHHRGQCIQYCWALSTVTLSASSFLCPRPSSSFFACADCDGFWYCFSFFAILLNLFVFSHPPKSCWDSWKTRAHPLHKSRWYSPFQQFVSLKNRQVVIKHILIHLLKGRHPFGKCEAHIANGWI